MSNRPHFSARCRRGSFFFFVLVSGLESTAAISYDDVQDRATAETKLGVVVGRALPNGVDAFLGMPYALPPIGKLRFEPPVPLASWGKDRRDALSFGAECMQSTANSPSPPSNISEDCLFLNVWSPSTPRKSGAKLPVMVWLYGGGFQQGASSHPEYDGSRLADRGVVVVSINYRLGALGWMASVGDNLWGNYGLQDQRLGMEWVHDNIGAFGGDPGRVTLFGESAGAMSIGQHLNMDGAGVLFQQVIMQSNPIGYRFRSVTVANFLGEAMKRGLDCDNLACLQHESAAEIIRVQESIMGVPRSVGDFFTWGPVVTDRNYRRHVGKHQKIWTSADSRTLDSDSKAADGGTGRGDSRTGPDFDYKAPFMNVGQPLEVWESAAGVSSAAVAAGGGGATSNVGVGTRRAAGRGAGRDKDDDFGPPPVPVILGVNADEGLMFVHGAFPLTMPKLVYYSFVAALFRQSVVGVLRTYGYLAEQCEESGDYRRVMSQIMHDYLFRCPNQRAAHLLQGQYGRVAPVFVYEFSHPTEVPGFPECSGMSCHTAELPFVFDNMDIIRERYSYHQTSGPAAPVPPTVEDNDASSSSDDRGAGNGSDSLSSLLNPARVVGSAWGAVQWGVVSVVKSGFGIGKLFGGGGGGGGGGRRESSETSTSPPLSENNKQSMTSPAEEVASAMGLGEGARGLALSAAASIAGLPSATDEEGGAGREGRGAAGGDNPGGSERGEEGDCEATPVKACESQTEASVKEGVSSRPEEGPMDREATGSGDEDDGLWEDTGANRAGRKGDGKGRSRSDRAVGERERADEEEGGSPSSEDGVEGIDERPRPTADEAAEMDAMVGHEMGWYWASFGKAGDPNNAHASVLWPAWEGRRALGQQDAANAAAMAAVLTAGGNGDVSFSGVFADAWTQELRGAGLGDGGFSGGWGVGGSYVLDIKARPEVKESPRDCVCEFWDRLKYRH